METLAEILIPAPRLAVWDALVAEAADGVASHVEGTPEFGPGTRAVSLGPPLPPDGMRTVMLHEIDALLEGYWLTARTYATAWEHTETLTLRDVDGGTQARLAGWWLRPAPPNANLQHMREPLTRLAFEHLERVRARTIPGG
ncbi:hypothetical protein [Cellulomonas sp. URHB0016]